MTALTDPLDRRLLEDWQRNLPLVPRPFAEIAQALGCSETDVLQRLARFTGSGVLSRVGATVRPNTAGASTLAAIAAPKGQLEEKAFDIAAEPGVNHVYARDDAWNIWFVATGPDRAHVDGTLGRIGEATGLHVVNAPLVRPYHIDLGFGLDGTRQRAVRRETADMSALEPGDTAILGRLTTGLGLVPRPFASLGQGLDLTEAEVIGRVRALVEAGIITRMGMILRHRALGWTANAMVVWQIAEDGIDEIGARLAGQAGVTLCYQRRPDPKNWPYNLYCMIHARTRDEGLQKLSAAADGAGIGALPRRVLFSTRCFKQTGAMVTVPKESAA